MAVGLALPVGCDNAPATGASGSSGSTGSGEDGSSSGRALSTASTAPTAGPTGSNSDATTASNPSDPSDPTTDPSDGPTTVDPTASESGSEEGPVPGDGWLEVGHGLDEFFAFEEELPLILGPQGFMMFSLPLRGSGFPIPPDPFDYDHPDRPMLSIWTDIEGIEGTHPSGYFAAYFDYPVPFTVSDEEDVDYEFVSVWLVIPETHTPAELAGREATVHAELTTADGQLLIDEHTLTVLDATVEQGS